MATPTTTNAPSKKRGSNLMPRTRKSYYNSDVFKKNVKDGIESLQVYLSGKGQTITREHKEAIKFFAAPFERDSNK